MKDNSLFLDGFAFGGGEIFGGGGKPPRSLENLRFCSNILQSSLNSRRICKDIYYSARPPSSPVEIIAFPEEIASEDGSNLISSWSKVDWDGDFSSAAAWVVPVFSLDPPNPELMAHLSYLETLYQDEIPRQPYKNSTATRTVRPILNTLLDDLPLTKSEGSPITVIETRIFGKSKESLTEINLKRIEVREGVDDNLEGNLAKGWMGGVRALRDSHLRLILRQLRHVHRINRTIDRAARATNKTKL